MAPILKDFSNRWTTAIEILNKEVGMHFAKAASGKDVLQVGLRLLDEVRLYSCSF